MIAKYINSYAKLEEHGHHSDNTHKVLFGEPWLGVTQQPHTRSLGLVFKAGTEMQVKAGTCYSGTAGPEGCLFDEGHQRLSLTTAERFVARGTLKKGESLESSVRRKTFRPEPQWMESYVCGKPDLQKPSRLSHENGKVLIDEGYESQSEEARDEIRYDYGDEDCNLPFRI